MKKFLSVLAFVLPMMILIVNGVAVHWAFLGVIALYGTIAVSLMVLGWVLNIVLGILHAISQGTKTNDGVS